MTGLEKRALQNVAFKPEIVYLFGRANRLRYVSRHRFPIEFLLRDTAKLSEVTRLMDRLSSDLQQINLLPHRKDTLHITCMITLLTDPERDAHLEQVKVYGRDPTNADPIFTKEASHTCRSLCLLKLTSRKGNRNLDPACLQ